jgi:plasmid stabilization system protein ParE
VSIVWTPEAQDDVDRLADFVAAYDSGRADKIEEELSAAPKRLLEFPRRGSRFSQYDPREIREYRTGGYLLRYELREGDIVVLRVFHGREDRF